MKAKPFIKWVGGKTQLIDQLEALLPADFDNWENVTYIEPFVGGGAMLFHMLQAHSNIQSAIINDINADLTTCYKVVKSQPDALVASLKTIQAEYYNLKTEAARKQFFLRYRELFNAKNLNDIENTTLFFFLNRTCFNGLYRVNKSGFFNVPFGKYETPTICDPTTIYADSELLQRVEILTGDYTQTLEYAKGNTFFYFDPPYRPLNATSSFNDYDKEAFNDLAQKRLKDFCDKVDAAGYHFMLSNSDCFAHSQDRFFDDLYVRYNIERVLAGRSINANPAKRGKLSEILVHNYSKDIYMPALPKESFETFLSQLQETNATLDFYCDFEKIAANVAQIGISLNMLNYLIGKDDLRAAVEALYQRDKTVFDVMDILIATRKKDRKKYFNALGEFKEIHNLFDSVDGIMEFLEGTGLAQIFKEQKVKDLVEYVFGVETGLDTNARKNRSGEYTEQLVAQILDSYGIRYKEQVSSFTMPEIKSVLGVDEKRFDFVIKTAEKSYLMEVNFYSGGGSKLNEVARAYSDIAPKINSVEGYEFVWLTDGIGWRSASSKLEEAYSIIPRIYNLTTIHDFINEIKDAVL